MEKKISELEEELKRTELNLVMIGEYEGGNDLYYQLLKDPKTGNWVAIASPFQIEKKMFMARIDVLQAEIRRIQEKLYDIKKL